MATPALAFAKPTSMSPGPARSNAAVNELAAELLRLAKRSTQSGETLLDLEIDGVRCTIVRVNPGDGRSLLSPREQEIARMVAEGHPNKMIAAVLEISSWTVSTHLRRIFAKLGVTTRAAMVAKVIKAH